MPVLSRFYGIIIRMYFLQSEHNPPHIHAIYNEDVAAIDFMTGEVLEGYLPSKAMNLVQEWISLAIRGSNPRASRRSISAPFCVTRLEKSVLSCASPHKNSSKIDQPRGAWQF